MPATSIAAEVMREPDSFCVRIGIVVEYDLLAGELRPKYCGQQFEYRPVVSHVQHN